jgi:hypothetical protein
MCFRKNWGYSLTGESWQDNQNDNFEPLTADSIAQAVWDSLKPNSQKRTSLKELQEITNELSLENQSVTKSSSALRVVRLKFSGKKQLNNSLVPKNFVYTQDFSPGVNVICVPDNSKGKSSILKTIKFALTGDDREYDIDVRSWITDIWLTFRLNKQEYTVLHTDRQSHRMLIVPKVEDRLLEEVADNATAIILSADTRETIKIELSQFFFKRLGLEELAWNQINSSSSDGISLSRLSWLTYFQALYIPDNGDEYLFVDEKHNMGNQGGLMLSAFLGLSFAKPLNELGLESSRQEKTANAQKQQSVQVIQAAKNRIVELQKEQEAIQASIRSIYEHQSKRQKSAVTSEPVRKMAEINVHLMANLEKQKHLQLERSDLGQQLKKLRASKRRYEEAIALSLHFTGIEVSLCPNCDQDIDAEAVQHETSTHQCRLCGKPAHDADQGHVEEMQQFLESVENDIQLSEKNRAALSTQLATLIDQHSQLATQSDQLTSQASQGLDFVLPTPEEQANLRQFYELLGRVQAGLTEANKQIQASDTVEESNKVYAIGKVRDYLKKQAAERNAGLLSSLTMATQNVAQIIGVESVTDISCSELGSITLRKHDQKVSFSGINNQGERLRIKLAFFLAMMQLGGLPNRGHHPGFLMIDQPGTGEMVTEDFIALAKIFCELDSKANFDFQIICATARPEFAEATTPEKFYGPQNPPYAF